MLLSSLAMALAFLTAPGAFAAGLAASDNFCSTPSKQVCNQKKIESDLGTTIVGSDVDDIMRVSRQRLKVRVSALFAKQFSDSASLGDSAQLATSLHLNRWTTCLLPTTQICERKVSDAISQLAVEDILSFDEDPLGPLHQTLSLEDIEQIRSSRLFKMARALALKEMPLNESRPKTLQNAQSLFAALRVRYLAQVKAWQIPEPFKQNMLDRLAHLKIESDGPACDRTVPATYLVNASNVGRTNTVQICSGLFLKTNSIATLAMVIGHEIGHTIGPCNFPRFGGTWSATNEQMDRPYGALLRCINAESPRSQLRYCEARSQASERFADWAASEVAMTYLSDRYPSQSPDVWRARVRSTWAFACGAGDEIHPATEDRYDELLLHNSHVRQLVACPSMPANVECKMGMKSLVTPWEKPSPTGSASAKAVK